LGEKYAEKMQKMMGLTARSQKKGKSMTQKVLDNGDLEFTFTFSNFGKQLDAEIQKKINAVVQKSSNAQSFGSKLKHMVSTVSSDQVSTHGMENQQNACFCISAIQLLFSIPQIRTIVKKHGCDSEVLAQILHPDHKITTVNNDGIMCALFNLFEELGENMALFSTLTTDFKAGDAVPYELLGYIMKNFEVDRQKTDNPYTVGKQEDADAFLTFLFGIFEKNKIPIEHLFQFTIKSTHGTPKERDDISWPLGLARDTSGNILLKNGMPKQVFSIEGSTSVEVGKNAEKKTEIKKDTITLKKNPYVLIRTSINQIGDIVIDASGSVSQPRYNKIDLDAITPELTIDGKKFKLFGSIQYNGYSVPVNSADSSKGTNTAGHYIYTRRDLASKKGIIYDDRTLTLDDDIGKGRHQFPHYLLVYAEVGSAEPSKKVAAVEASDAAEVEPEEDENAEEAEGDHMGVVDDDVEPASEGDLKSIETEPKPAANVKFTELLAKKIEERLKVAQTIKDATDVNSPAMIRIKKAFGIPEAEGDRNKIMNGILGNIDMWMKHIGAKDPSYHKARLDYITFLVLKSKIDQKLNPTAFRYNGEISHKSSKAIAQDLIDHYKDITLPAYPTIEAMAAHIIEPLNFDQLEVAKNKKEGGRRMLRAKKHILRASKQSSKKRTLRASKKLRQLLNST
jgi:hypothetical protein